MTSRRVLNAHRNRALRRGGVAGNFDDAAANQKYVDVASRRAIPFDM